MSKDNEQDIFESEVEESFEETPSSNTNKPWNRKFTEDENIKRRQYSRTARNQPAKEATTLSKVLLFIIVVTVITPFLLFMWVNSQRENDKIPSRSAEQITYSRASEISQASQSEDESSQADESTQVASSNEVSRESIESSSVTESSTPPAPTTPPVAEESVPEETVPSAGGTHTVVAGDNWFAISRQYGVDVYALMEANGATTDTPLYPGNTVVIP